MYKNYEWMFNSSLTVLWLAFAIVFIVAGWKIFEKAGERGWKVLIPIYNAYITLKLVGRPAWWLLLMLIPWVNFIVSIIVAVDVARAFGKDVIFAILGLVLTPFGALILGFGDAKYQGPSPVKLG